MGIVQKLAEKVKEGLQTALPKLRKTVVNKLALVWRQSSIDECCVILFPEYHPHVRPSRTEVPRWKSTALR